MYKKTILDNGLRIITHQMPKMQSVALGIWIKVGGRYEPTAIKGISHFLEHLLFKGSQKYSCRRIKESIEGVGGMLNAFTSEELTCYLVKIPAKYLNLALAILSDMVRHPTLPLPEIEKEKQVILEEIKMYRDQPASYVYELLDELLWPNQPLGEPVIGTAESVSSISKKELTGFKEQFYTPANIIVSAAGLLDQKKLFNHIKRLFSQPKKQGINKFSQAQEDRDAGKIKIFHKDTEQSHLAMGFKSFKRDHPLRHAVSLLHIILGANMSSRLFNEVREKRALAYEIGTQVKRFQDTGAFIVHAGIDNQKVVAAIQLILEELKKAGENLVSEDEFRRAREFYLGQLMLALEDTLDHMLWIGETTASLDKTYSLSQIVKEVKKISRQDIMKVAQEIFKEDKIKLALVGPLKDKEEELRKCRL